MLMVKAGKPVDEFIEHLLPHLEAGDIIIDGGNSLYEDTSRRVKYVESKGLLYIGTGVSGGEEGARNGPSIMPGGSPAAWPHVKDIFQGIAAKVADGTPCCDWVGEGGAGHYVKMVHNGIEYGDMQLICEAYQLMKDGLGMTPDEMSAVFAEWNKGELDSYLIENHPRHSRQEGRGRGAARRQDSRQTAGQKGTGKWTVISSADLGIPITLMAEAVYGRCVSAMKDLRVEASKSFKPGNAKISGDRALFVRDISHALYALQDRQLRAGLHAHVRGGRAEQVEPELRRHRLMWRGGCIIRSAFLGDIKAAFDKNKKLTNLLLAPFFKKAIKSSQRGWRKVVSTAVKKGIRCRLSARRFPSSTASAPSASRRTCCKRSATTSARTPTSAWTNRAASSSTRTGPGRGGTTASSTYSV